MRMGLIVRGWKDMNGVRERIDTRTGWEEKVIVMGKAGSAFEQCSCLVEKIEDTILCASHFLT